EPQVPFANNSSRITGSLKHVGQSRLGVINNQRRVTGQYRRLSTEGIITREHRITRGRASRRRAVSIGKSNTFAGQLIDVGSLYCGGTIATQVTVTQIVDIEE